MGGGGFENNNRCWGCGKYGEDADHCEPAPVPKDRLDELEKELQLKKAAQLENERQYSTNFVVQMMNRPSVPTCPTCGGPVKIVSTVEK